jgi:bifunctional DNA-binding transcriptional regulator/antitoxin component of YhaV-PrlF toxin-antitoxin module
MAEPLHRSVRSGSQKARIWEICDTLLRERGVAPTGREVVDLYVAEGGNEGTGFTQYSHWKRAHEASRASDADAEEPGPASNALAEPSTRFEPASADGYFSLWIAADGRLVVPQTLREAMMLDPDGRVTAHVEDGELRVISPLAAIRRMQRIAQKYKKPGVSVVDEFLAERRAMWGEE